MKLAPDDVKYETTTKERKRSLVIKDVKPEDAGKYVCEVGPHRTTAVVEVTKPKEEKPKGSSILDSKCAWVSGSEKICSTLSLFVDSGICKSMMAVIFCSLLRFGTSGRVSMHSLRKRVSGEDV